MSDASSRMLISGFGFMLILLLLVTVIGLGNMKSQNDRLQYMVDVRNHKSEIIVDMRNVARERSLVLYQMVISQDPFETDEGVIRLSELAGSFLGNVDRLRNMGLDSEESKQLDRLFDIAIESTLYQRKVIDLLKQEEYKEASSTLTAESIPAQNRLLAAYDEFVAQQSQLSKEAAQEASTSYRYAVTTMLLLSGSLLILGVISSIFVIRHSTHVQKQLRELNQSLESRVAERTHELSETNKSLTETLNTLSQTQSQLVQSEKMASLGGLVAGISHEVNTPIGIGMTAASHLEDEVSRFKVSYEAGNMKRSALEDFMRHALESSSIILQNLKRASSLIGSFKRVAVDQTSEEWHSINVHEYIDDIITSLRPRFKGSNIIVENLCDRDVDFYTNPGAIYQVISNLMLNSLLHAYDEGQSGVIHIYCEFDQRQLTLTVQDDGKGIPEESLSKIFDPFFTTRRGTGGSGLGLHLVYNLVTTGLQGSIDVQSTVGRGVVFKIMLPVSIENTSS
jgi:signal transduction histidine kinase